VVAYDRFALSIRKTRETSRLLLSRRVGVPAAMVVVALMAVGAWRLVVSPPLSVTVEGGAVDEGGFVRAGTTGEPSMRFSDGSEISLAPLSRARITETTRKGARVTLEEGSAQARVMPRKGAEWVFDAGPCRVQVTGTRFEMRWSAPEQVLEVRLYSGGVTVKGPPAMAGVPMRAGQRLVMDVRQSSVRLTDLVEAAPRAANDVGPAAATAETAPSAAAEGPPPVAPAPGANPTASSATIASWGVGARRGEPWTARVLAGEFRTVIDDAERRGIEGVLASDSATNIMALADAARFAGAFPLAQKALLKIRGRFPRTASAHKAAFLLGRIAEDQHGNLGRALEWYETYLADAPDNAFRAEAMGRRMSASLRLSGATQARDFAAEYLNRYPQGAYAKAARAILSP
jgi:TolA-binding protein